MEKKVSSFADKVYKTLLKVPKGKVTTYKELAKAVNTKAYQAIGQVMRSNPFAPKVPCHRVVKTDGSIGGFIGETEGKAITKKIKLLKEEGVEVKKGKIIDFQDKLHQF